MMLHFNDSKIELVFDNGLIETINGDSLPINELELELKDGKQIDILEFAILLSQQMQVMPFNSSKAKRGFKLFEDIKQKDDILELLNQTQTLQEQLIYNHQKLRHLTHNNNYHDSQTVATAYLETLMENFND
jgi:inorganic triphosphatase YgiF